MYGITWKYKVSHTEDFMKEKVVLALTHERDDAADLVLAPLRERGARCVRFNTEYFHSQVQYAIDIEKNGKFSGKFIFPDCTVPFEDIGVVWNRRVHEPAPHPDLSERSDLQAWTHEETTWAMRGVFTLFDCPVVNPWEVNERLKFNKMFQMRKAAEVGLEIPLSIITDIPDEIRNFWQRAEREVIFKKIRRGLFEMNNGERLLVQTNRIPPESQTDETINRMRFAPVFLEQHIPKKYDVRSIIVGDRVFSFAIHSQEIPEGRVDYRKAAILKGIGQMPHEIIDLGDEVNQKLLKFCRSFNLTFSAIDLIITPDDRVVFLEDNPNGQWAWLQHITKAPIGSAIADVLIEKRDE